MFQLKRLNLDKKDILHTVTVSQVGILNFMRKEKGTVHYYQSLIEDIVYLHIILSTLSILSDTYILSGQSLILCDTFYYLFETYDIEKMH